MHRGRWWSTSLASPAFAACRSCWTATTARARAGAIWQSSPTIWVFAPYGPAARHAMVRALGEAASTKHELEDLINVAIEQLVRQRFELPAFDTLNRAARRVRATYNRALYKRVYNALSEDDVARID